MRWGGVGAGEVKLRDKALQALGQLFISRPALMLLDASLEVTASALAPAAPLLLKHRMLSNLTELLKARRPRFISFYPVHPASRLCQYRFLHVVPGPRAPPHLRSRQPYQLRSSYCDPPFARGHLSSGIGVMQAEEDRQVRAGLAAGEAGAVALDAAASAQGEVDHESAAAVAAQNGRGESVGASSGVLQAGRPALRLPWE